MQEITQIWHIFGLLLLLLCGLALTASTQKVHCTEDEMRVDISTTIKPNKTLIYLDGLKGYPDVRCQPEINGSSAVFRLSLNDFYECGITRMVNQITGKKVYYHKIIIEAPTSKDVVAVKCIISGSSQAPSEKQNNSVRLRSSGLLQQLALQRRMEEQAKQQPHAVMRRDVLPAGFQEPDDLEILPVTQRAPEPRLSISVSQDGVVFNNDLTVKSGTPLTMEITLDPNSASIYGLGVNTLEVTDTHGSAEMLIFKGCTIDPYLFENFNTFDGDMLSAKFRAFKFPDSPYVQFLATVNVCLDKCLGTLCSNNQTGYGRRKREINTSPIDANKVYEISLTVFFKVDDADATNKNEILQLDEKLRELKLANQRLARNSRGSFAALVERPAEQTPVPVPAFVVEQQQHARSAAALVVGGNLLSLALATLFTVIHSLHCQFL